MGTAHDKRRKLWYNILNTIGYVCLVLLISIFFTYIPAIQKQLSLFFLEMRPEILVLLSSASINVLFLNKIKKVIDYDDKQFWSELLDEKLKAFKNCSPSEAFSFATEAIRKKGQKIKAFGVVKDISIKEKQEYLDSITEKIKTSSQYVIYKRIMSENFNEAFRNHLLTTLNLANKGNNSNIVDKRVEIAIVGSFLLPYSSLIIDENFLMLSLNYPGSDQSNETYMVSHDPVMVRRFSNHFDAFWNTLGMKYNNHCFLTTSQELISIHEDIKKVRSYTDIINRSLYQYPRNPKNFSLHYAMESLGEIADLFDEIPTLRYSINNTQNIANIVGLYSNYLKSLLHGDRFETITSVSFWSYILHDHHQAGENDFKNIHKAALTRGVKINRVLIVQNDLPNDVSINFNLKSIKSYKNTISDYKYWIDVIEVINYHIGLLENYQGNGYEFSVKFENESTARSEHAALITTNEKNKTLFTTESKSDSQIQKTEVVTFISDLNNTRNLDNIILNQESFAGARKEQEFQKISIRQKELIDYFKNEHRWFFQKKENLISVFGRNYDKGSNDLSWNDEENFITE